MNAQDDDIYCHEVARRAVARAALHLGLESMSQEALDVLADVLLSYLQKIGKVLSSNVESSRRTSAHVNVLDALDAIAMCSSPAVHRLNLENEEAQDADVAAESTTTNSMTDTTAWQDLAQFLFGPQWDRRHGERIASITDDDGADVPLGTGKVGPGGSNASRRVGWEAPYLNEVPSFPLASEKCANPHTLSESVSRSLHMYEAPKDTSVVAMADNTVGDMPDGVFQIEWGSVMGGVAQKGDQDEKQAAMDETAEKGEPPKKRPRLDGVKASVTTQGSSDLTRPFYIPSFMPPFPMSISMGRRDIVDLDDSASPPSEVVPASAPDEGAAVAATNDKKALAVRASLVKLGEFSYWGSGWDAPATGLKVPLGRRDTEGAAAPSGVVLPVTRPSGSRVGRILEGSMEPTV